MSGLDFAEGVTWQATPQKVGPQLSLRGLCFSGAVPPEDELFPRPDPLPDRCTGATTIVSQSCFASVLHLRKARAAESESVSADARRPADPVE